jgi:hypothetical protein
MSNAFYRIRVFDSDCGNFGSNASMPLNLISFPSEAEPTCADLGTFTDPSLNGRKVTMLQKQYFGKSKEWRDAPRLDQSDGRNSHNFFETHIMNTGGLQLSQGVYEWATTPLKGLEDVLGRLARHDIQRAGVHHSIVCEYRDAAIED